MERHLAFLVECRGAFSSLNELKVRIFSFLFLETWMNTVSIFNFMVFDIVIFVK